MSCQLNPFLDRDLVVNCPCAALDKGRAQISHFEQSAFKVKGSQQNRNQTPWHRANRIAQNVTAAALGQPSTGYRLTAEQAAGKSRTRQS